MKGNMEIPKYAQQRVKGLPEINSGSLSPRPPVDQESDEIAFQRLDGFS